MHNNVLSFFAAFSIMMHLFHVCCPAVGTFVFVFALWSSWLVYFCTQLAFHFHWRNYRETTAANNYPRQRNKSTNKTDGNRAPAIQGLGELLPNPAAVADSSWGEAGVGRRQPWPSRGLSMACYVGCEQMNGWKKVERFSVCIDRLTMLTTDLNSCIMLGEPKSVVGLSAWPSGRACSRSRPRPLQIAAQLAFWAAALNWMTHRRLTGFMLFHVHTLRGPGCQEQQAGMNT